MVFSSLTFLYIFLPIVLILNYIIRKEFRNTLLLIASLIFYAWGGVNYTAILIISVVLNYIIGRLISKNINTHYARIYLIIGIIINLGFLGVFKYANFITENINFLLRSTGFSFSITNPGIILPIGISFYTFQALSYIIDVYKQKAPVQKRLVNLALYISLFPQLIAGPIVRYNDIAEQLTKRLNNRANFVSGIERFVLGLAKKVLIANQFALIADTAFGIAPQNLSTFVAWGGILAYSIQIYFDFSGYSDMAIGLGRMFGFHYFENFNFPYIAKSIREFWQRWHISLTNWFRDYLYIPLGGNRKGNIKTYVNLLIVFFITGIWHGASWNFIVWGMLHGLFMLLERLGFSKFLSKLWTPLQHLYTLFIVMMAWVLFRAENFQHAWGYYKAMFVHKSMDLNNDVLDMFFNNVFYFLLIIAVLSSTTIWIKIYNATYKIFSASTLQKNILNACWSGMTLVFIIVVMVLSTISLVTNSYNPFIYFRF